MKADLNHTFNSAKQLPQVADFAKAEAFVLSLNPEPLFMYWLRKVKFWIIGTLALSFLIIGLSQKNSLPILRNHSNSIPIVIGTNSNAVSKTPNEEQSSIVSNSDTLVDIGLDEVDDELLEEAIAEAETKAEKVPEVPQKPKEGAHTSALESEKTSNVEVLKETEIQEEDCTCACSEDKVFTHNQIQVGGIMSFYFSCSAKENSLSISRQELKEIHGSLWKNLKKSTLKNDQFLIEFDAENQFMINHKSLPKDELESLKKILQELGFEAASHRKILLDKRQIWVGDFVDGEFYGSARGVNVRNNLVDDLMR